MHEVEDLNVLIAHYYPCLSSDIEGLCKQRRCQQQWRKLRNEMWETKESDIKSLKTTRTADFFTEWLNTLSLNGRDEICELVQMFCLIVLSSVPRERIFIYIYISTYVCLHLHLFMCTYMNTNTYVYLCLYVYHIFDFIDTF